jgi:hypothetical protein
MYQCSDDYSDAVIATRGLKKFATRGSRYDTLDGPDCMYERKNMKKRKK